MNGKGHGQLRRSQVITTFGPGALIGLPNDSAIVGGLDTWGGETNLERIDEPRLSAKLASMTGVPGRGSTPRRRSRRAGRVDGEASALHRESGRRGHAGRPGAGGPAHREPLAARASQRGVLRCGLNGMEGDSVAPLPLCWPMSNHPARWTDLHPAPFRDPDPHRQGNHPAGRCADDTRRCSPVETHTDMRP